MKKIFRGIFCGSLCAVMAFGFAGCGDGEGAGGGGGGGGGGNNESGTYVVNPETRPLVLSVSACDGNFSPFYSTSASDSEVVANTQIAMLTTNSDGEPVCGQNEATVAESYKITYYDAPSGGNIIPEGSMDGRSEYEFVIKKGIKFSNGSELTIKDVLFNLYVYLDPMYFGSSTIYSTDIQGLAQYRAQSMDADSDSDYTAQFTAIAMQRVQDILDYDDDPVSNPINEQITADIETVKKLFREELESDWSNNVGTLSSYEENYSFTEDWEVYYLNEGIIQIQTELDPSTGSYKRKKDANGKYLTTLDEEGNQLAQDIHDAMNDPAKIAEAQAQNGNCTEAEAKAFIMRDYAIDTLYGNYFNEGEPLPGALTTILTQWATAGTARQDFKNDAMSRYYDGITQSGGLAVSSVSGITTYKNSNGNDVLKIVVNGVDPKAIWNFGFTVAPMYYYSGTYGGVNYIELCNQTDPSNSSVSNRFGVKFGDKNFFDTIVGSTEKSKKPMGAGVYKATDSNGSDNSSGSNFRTNGWVYYKRNEYFNTVGSGLCNAKIKYMRYREVKDDDLINFLKTKSIDFGSPQCTPDNINELNGISYLSTQSYKSNGYGYVGINPKYVPDVAVRRAIMRAMETTKIVSDYYTTQYAETIYRPMSKLSFAYPKGCTVYDGGVDPNATLAFTRDGDVIEGLLRSAGYSDPGDGVWTNDKGNKLKYTFTIAGEETNHPAATMFREAADFLNQHGFDITVQNDIQALQKLATGKLAVWAAAWTLGIDPDLYQVYHKDSTATSVKNWGYDVIVGNENDYPYEAPKVDTLSSLIMEARTMNNEDSRAAIYEDALNIIMDLAVELPTYQRMDLAVYNNDVLNINSLNKNANAYNGVLSRLWEVDYRKA